MYELLTKPRLRVVSEPAVVLAEVTEAEAVQVALVGGVAEGAEIRVVRGFDPDDAARAHQAMELLHGANHVVHMLDYVNGRQPVERTIGKRVRESIQIGQHVRAAGGIP